MDQSRQHNFEAGRFLERHYPGMPWDLDSADFEYTQSQSLCVYRAHNVEEIQILALVVHPNFRRRGIASRIIEDRKSNASAIHANVMVNDPMFTAIFKFWQQLGFQPLEIINPGSALHMAWRMTWRK